MMLKVKDKLLFLTTVDLSVESGGTRFSKTILNELSSKFEIEVITLAKCQMFRNVKIRWLISIAKSIFTGVPPNVVFHSGLLKKEVTNKVREYRNFIVIDHLESYCLTSSHIKTSAIYVSHNRESNLVNQKLPSFPKWFNNHFATWIDHYEKSLLRAVGGVVCISNSEAKWYSSLSQNVTVIYPVFSFPSRALYEQFSEFPSGLRIGFIGSGNWLPNAEAVDVLISNIVGLVKRKIEFVLAGGDWIEDVIHTLIKSCARNENVSLRAMGYVKDINDFWSSIDVFVAPIVSGAGVNVKVCESIANGIPVVCFPHAIRGLPDSLVLSSRVFVANTFFEFAGYLEDFKGNKQKFFFPREFTSNFASDAIFDVISRIPVKSF